MANEQFDPNQDTDNQKVDTDTRSEREIELETKFAAQQSEAEELGFANHADYQDFLEEKANEVLTVKEAPKTEDAPKAPTQPKPKVSTPAPTIPVEQPNYDERFEQTDQASRTAYLEAQFVQNRLDQSELPKEERHGFSKKEIMAVLQDRPSAVMIKELMADPQYDSNVISATVGYMKIKDLAEASKKQAAATNAAKTSEKETATIDPGQTVPPAENEEKSENDKLADEVCEDEVYIYPGD